MLMSMNKMKGRDMQVVVSQPAWEAKLTSKFPTLKKSIKQTKHTLKPLGPLEAFRHVIASSCYTSPILIAFHLRE